MNLKKSFSFYVWIKCYFLISKENNALPFDSKIIVIPNKDNQALLKTKF